VNYAPVDGVSRKTETKRLLLQIQGSEDDKHKQKLAWQVVMLNDAAATWLAKRFCPAPGEDDVSEARLSLYDAALYCHPEKGSSYLSVACWYYMRRTTGKRTGVGIHVPSNTAQLMSRIKSWMAAETDKGHETPTLEDAIVEFNLTMDPLDLHIAMWAVSNPRGEGTFSIGGINGVEQEEDSSRFDMAYEVEETREHKHDLDKMKKAMKRLTPVEKAAVLTYGGDTPPLRVVGEEHGISREWVNQTRKRAIRTLRAAMRVRGLDG
jgi:RNA polymerase sigma factor (sigma-70 family)